MRGGGRPRKEKQKQACVRGKGFDQSGIGVRCGPGAPARAASARARRRRRAGAPFSGPCARPRGRWTRPHVCEVCGQRVENRVMCSFAARRRADAPTSAEAGLEAGRAWRERRRGAVRGAGVRSGGRGRGGRGARRDVEPKASARDPREPPSAEGARETLSAYAEARESDGKTTEERMAEPM